MYQARSRGRFQPRINSHISYTKTNILIIKTHSTSNSNNNYAKFTKKYLNHYFLRKIYLGLLSLFLSSRCSIVASNYRPYHVYCRFGNLSTNRLWYAFSGDVESRDKYRHLGMFKNYFFSAVEIDRKNGNGLMDSLCNEKGLIWSFLNNLYIEKDLICWTACIKKKINMILNGHPAYRERLDVILIEHPVYRERLYIIIKVLIIFQFYLSRGDITIFLNSHRLL